MEREWLCHILIMVLFVLTFFYKHHPLAADNLYLGASLVVLLAHFALTAMTPVLILTVTQKITLHCHLLDRKDDEK